MVAALTATLPTGAGTQTLPGGFVQGGLGLCLDSLLYERGLDFRDTRHDHQIRVRGLETGGDKRAVSDLLGLALVLTTRFARFGLTNLMPRFAE